jgi:flagellar protein FliL
MRRIWRAAAVIALTALVALAAPPALAASAPAPAPGPVGPPFFFDLPDMLVNLNAARNRTAFLKIKITVEVAAAEDIGRVNSVMPMVLDGVQMYLRELKPENIAGSAGMYRLRQDLIARISAPAHPAKVKDVLFKELLVQ